MLNWGEPKILRFSHFNIWGQTEEARLGLDQGARLIMWSDLTLMIDEI